MVFFLVVASTSAASDGAVGVGLVSKSPASVTLDKADLLNPFGEEAGSVEEDEWVLGEGSEVVLLRIGDTEANVAALLFGNSVLVGPGRALKEDNVLKDWVGLMDLMFQFFWGDFGESTRKYPGIFIRDCIFISDPVLGWDVADDNSGLFCGLNEDGLGASPCDNPEDCFPCFLDLGVHRVVGEEDGKVECGCPLSRVCLDV